LPAWDEYLVSYKDRQAVLQSDNHRKAISSNGIFHPVIVVNGKVIGLWKKTTNKKQPVLLEFF
jgi:Na+-translocating ferredoxin:NAD+ oxidoreductase RnfE subunit